MSFKIFDEVRDRVELDFEAVIRVKLEKEDRWTVLVGRDEVFQGKSRTRRKCWWMDESRRKSSAEERGDVDTLCWPVGKCPRSNSCGCFFFLILIKKDVRLWRFLECLAFL